MSKDLNQCNFIGRLGKPPEVRATSGGSRVATISLACSDDYRDKNTGETVSQTNWIRVVFFGRLAEIVEQYLTDKGAQIFVSGKYVTRQWKDDKGQDRYTTEIVAGNMQMLGSRGDASNNDAAVAKAPPLEVGGSGGAGPDIDFQDDVPFNSYPSDLF